MGLFSGIRKAFRKISDPWKKGMEMAFPVDTMAVTGIGKALGLAGNGYDAGPAPGRPTSPFGMDAQDTADEELRGRRRRGMAASMLTGAGGAGLPNSASKTLTGQ